MQAVILAAGKGTRCYPLTLTRPKVLLPVMNKPILQHNLEQLIGLIDEVIIVTGYKGEMIKRLFGSSFKNIKINYVEQKELNGTGGAILACEHLLNDEFLVFNGDDLYSSKDIKRYMKHKLCIIAKEVSNPEKWGILEVKNNFVISLEEKPKNPKSNLANIGLYVLDKRIFKYKLKKSARGELELTDYVKYLIDTDKVHCETVSDYWIPVGYPWHMLCASEYLLNTANGKTKGTIEPNVYIKGKLILGKGSVIKSGTYIEGNVMVGENCIIGPNAYIRGSTVIGDNCKVGNACEVKNSILLNKTHVPHLSYVGDSIIGENVNLGAGTITANLRFDHKEIFVNVNGEKVNSNTKKLGAVIGDNVQIGINVNLMPGVKIWPNLCVMPGLNIQKDLKAFP